MANFGRHSVLQFLDDALIQDRSVTVHEFISLSHGSDPRVRVVAADLTMVAVCGLIVCAMLGLATVLKPLPADSAGFTELFIAAIFLVVVTCTLFSGHTGLMHGAQLQLGLLYFGLFGSTAFLLYLQVSQLGAMPLRGLVALALIAIICAVIHFRRHARYVDTNLIQSSATNAGVVRREREPASVRRLSRFQKILNSLIGVLAITLMVLATVVAALAGDLRPAREARNTKPKKAVPEAINCGHRAAVAGCNERQILRGKGSFNSPFPSTNRQPEFFEPCGDQHQFRAQTIHGMKVLLAGHPHARQGGKVVKLVHIGERFAHHLRVEH